jgi:hypothetical protein
MQTEIIVAVVTALVAVPLGILSFLVSEFIKRWLFDTGDVLRRILIDVERLMLLRKDDLENGSRVDKELALELKKLLSELSTINNLIIRSRILRRMLRLPSYRDSRKAVIRMGHLANAKEFSINDSTVEWKQPYKLRYDILRDLGLYNRDYDNALGLG